MFIFFFCFNISWSLVWPWKTTRSKVWLNLLQSDSSSAIACAELRKDASLGVCDCFAERVLQHGWWSFGGKTGEELRAGLAKSEHLPSSRRSWGSLGSISRRSLTYLARRPILFQSHKSMDLTHACSEYISASACFLCFKKQRPRVTMDSPWKTQTAMQCLATI